MPDRAVVADEPFVAVPVRSRFYQSSSFFPLPVVLVSTRAEDGATNLAPYSLLFPDPDPERPWLHLICRATSKTARNLERSGRAALCFIPDVPSYLRSCKVLGKPSPTDVKMKCSVFHLEASTRPPAGAAAAFSSEMMAIRSLQNRSVVYVEDGGRRFNGEADA